MDFLALTCLNVLLIQRVAVAGKLLTGTLTVPEREELFGNVQGDYRGLRLTAL
jgi:hypothetical protein